MSGEDDEAPSGEAEAMPEVEWQSFREFQAAGEERGGFETDDILNAVLPLMEQALEANERGRVAPLNGLEGLRVTHGHLWYHEGAEREAESAAGKLRRVEGDDRGKFFDVVDRRTVESDLDAGRLEEANRRVWTRDDAPMQPVYVTRYRSWEHLCGHHDALTDIYSLGMLLAALATGLDLATEEGLEAFADNREALHLLCPRLHPVVASAVVRMTALKRHERVQDLRTIIGYLRNYRDQPVDDGMQLMQDPGFVSAPTDDRRQMIHAKLRDRLFEMSRRNRLIYFRPTMGTANLTESSVPLMLDYRNIRPEQLFTWQPRLAEALAAEEEIPLNRYLRFEDAAYLPHSLDTIRRDANRDRKEYGFAQLRLVLVFFRWHNLKEDEATRIHSPLLLHPVDLIKKKGVRDSYHLQPVGTIAEVNPALRHFLKQLYNLDLPEAIDLAETSVDALYTLLEKQIKASEPAVEVKKLERPQIDLIHEKARKRLDLFLQRRRVSGRAVQSFDNIDYSYRRENFQPLGLQLFLHRVQPGELPLEHIVRERPVLRQPGVSPEGARPVIEKTRESYHLRSGSKENPYVWDFDLCALTLGNFNYRKMSLVRDYNLLLNEERANPAFDEVFALNGEDEERAESAPLPMEDQHLIVEADPTQQSAVAAARSGRNLIIQGPPGTGKSQTITNLIADYVANGKRVLFVCEKRAALDVVYHRLASQGLDRLTCLIHDSQADKKAFIHDLRETFEAFTTGEDDAQDWDRRAEEESRAVRRELEVIERFAGTMERPRGDGAYRVAELLERLVLLGAGAETVGAGDDEGLPGYEDWARHGAAVRRLALALKDVSLGEIFSATPFRVLKRECYAWENPVAALKGRIADERAAVDKARRDTAALSFSTATCSLDELLFLSFVAESARFLAQRNLLSLLDAKNEAAQAFERFLRKRDRQAKKLEKARQATANWKIKIAPGEVEAALGQAVALENSFLRFVQPKFWKLRGVMRSHYDFSAHAIAPAWSATLTQLRAEYEEQDKLADMDEEMGVELGIEEIDEVRERVEEFAVRRQSVPVDGEDDQAFFEALTKNDAGAAETVEALAAMQSELRDLIGRLDAFLVDAGSRTLEVTAAVMDALEETVGLLPEILPELTDMQEAPEAFFEALRTRDLAPDSFECSCAAKSLELAYREDRTLKRFEGWILRRHAGRIRNAHAAWQNLNGGRTVARVRSAFREKCATASKPAAQLTAEEKGFKKGFNKGRRELEHEFGKTMRYRSIRDLSCGHSGEVLMGLKPVWLMSPLSISDTIALGEVDFDVVVFDEASQIRLEEAVPAIYRAAQVVVVGDEMQLPPTDFFAAKGGEEDALVFEEDDEIEEYDLGADSFLSHVGRSLESTMLGWHYRSRYEALISFSNAQFYNGKLLTIPDLRGALGAREPIVVPLRSDLPDHSDAILARSISFHLQDGAIYENRRNRREAHYIAAQVRELLLRKTGLSIGIVAFSEAQQNEIESALDRLADDDAVFEALLAEEVEREEDGQFCGLFVKNLENVQGDERDIMLLSICYGPDAKGKMRMNFGPINRTGGEKRLNVIFSRAKRHMVIVSSIRSSAIKNDYNDGARCLKTFLEYAEAVSAGDEAAARRILGIADRAGPAEVNGTAVGDALQAALEARGYAVDRDVGQSEFRCDLALRKDGETDYRLGILLVDAAGAESVPVLERYVWRPALLEAFGWKVFEVLGKDWNDAPEEVLGKIDRLMAGADAGLAEEEDREIPEEHYEEVAAAEAETTAGVDEGDGGGATSEPGDGTGAPEPVREAAFGGVGEDAMRSLVYRKDGSEKFWQIERDGCVVRVRFGKVGTKGQVRERTLKSEKQAVTDFNRAIREKLRKGYVDAEWSPDFTGRL